MGFVVLLNCRLWAFRRPIVTGAAGLSDAGMADLGDDGKFHMNETSLAYAAYWGAPAQQAVAGQAKRVR